MNPDDLRSLLGGGGDALIVVPPFAGLDRPSLAAHLLQACAARAGLRVRVFYANLALAREMGEDSYEAISYAPTPALLGERFFARAAYGMPPFGRDDPAIEGAINDVWGQLDLSPESFRALERGAESWIDATAAAVAAAGFPVVGCSTSFEQTAASVALLNALKRRAPGTIALLGGANCEGEMAQGILSLGARVDYVFSGESEQTFPALLGELLAGRRPPGPVVTGTPCRALDDLPTPDFAEFFRQRDVLLPGSAHASDAVAWLPYETSRGCWWGEKHHCTFCGLNGQGMAFRQKSPDRAIDELRTLTQRHGLPRVSMVDNIMPHRFFQTLIPRLGRELPGLHVFYEQKANLSLEQLAALKRAGVAIIQPGIESLSTPLLRLMNKGITARQNIALLRYARAVDIRLNWNLLYGFPGDDAQEYRRMLEMIPYLRHLQPPSGLHPLSIDRFSPYHSAPQRYGVSGLRPRESYHSILPEGAEVDKVAYHFVGDYDSGSLRDLRLVEELEHEIKAWTTLWTATDSTLPALSVVALAEDQFVLIDTRGTTGAVPVRFLDRDEAVAALVPCPAGQGGGRNRRRALEQGLALELDGWFVPLATAAPELLSELEG